MSVGPVRTVRARMACLPEAIAFVESLCLAHGVAAADSLRLVLVLEELFTNAVTHGYGGDCDAPVRIALALEASEIALSFEDEAPPFDPIEQLDTSAVSVENAGGERPVGRLGIALVAGMAARVDYTREGGTNRLRIVLRRGG